MSLFAIKPVLHVSHCPSAEQVSQLAAHAASRQKNIVFLSSKIIRVRFKHLLYPVDA